MAPKRFSSISPTTDSHSLRRFLHLTVFDASHKRANKIPLIWLSRWWETRQQDKICTGFLFYFSHACITHRLVVMLDALLSIMLFFSYFFFTFLIELFFPPFLTTALREFAWRLWAVSRLSRAPAKQTSSRYPTIVERDEYYKIFC